ncbi:MAG: D-aminoacyl-tRNA deacylase [Planctomycetia bacterium]|jgi:D-tyrosyl-tRNA(Tyr) deacylase
MKACIQRVSRASVTIIEGQGGDPTPQVVGQIGPGLVVLLGVAETDTDAEAEKLAQKTVDLRIFEDDEGKMNRSLLESGGQMLVISQFTLLADCRKGRRPSFVAAAAPDEADRLYQVFTAAVRKSGVQTANGQFQAHMQVELVNDGPVTIWLDTEDLSRPRRS